MTIIRHVVANGYEEIEYKNGTIIRNPVQLDTPAQPAPPQETLEQRLERIEAQRQEDTLMQLDVLATIYEELIMKGSV